MSSGVEVRKAILTLPDHYNKKFPMLPAVGPAAVVPAAARTRTAANAVLVLVLLSAGHMFADLYSGALGALQPLLVKRFGMTLASAGLLGGLLAWSSSVMQPVYGYLSDRFRTRLFAALGPGVAGILISCLGVAPSYGWLLVMVAAGGAGIAAFHPQASSQATLAITRNRGRAMAVFLSAGTLGYAFGPSYFSIVTDRLGLGRAYWAAIPGLLISGCLLLFLPPPEPRKKALGGFDWPALRAVAGPLTILYMLVFLRSVVQIVFAQFIPLYLSRERGFSVQTASYTLTGYLAFGALGGFAGGHLADKFGGRRVTMFSMSAAVPCLAVFFLMTGWPAIVGLWLCGLILLFTVPVNVVMAQELVPTQAGTISALMMGFAWGMAGLVFIPLAGWASDLFSMHHVLMALIVFPLAGFFLSLRLKK
jgi:MFS transporter, FSR family, fosmidomycin resistance protein